MRISLLFLIACGTTTTGSEAPFSSREQAVVEAIAPGSAGYEAQTGSNKQAALWREISRAPYSTLPELGSDGIDGGTSAWQKVKNAAKLFKLELLRPAFDDNDDLRESDDAKLFHAFGVAAKARFEAEAGHPFTGLFQSGAPAIVRLSLAANPETAFAPGLALKLLLDGKSSRNIQSIHDLDGEDNRDFFAAPLSNRIPKPTGAAAKAAAAVTSLVADPFVRPVDHFASIFADGEQVTEPVTPYAIQFVSALHTDGTNDFRIELMQLPPGVALYDVYGKASEADAWHKVGTLISESEFVASTFEDKHLRFKHPR